MAGRRAIQVDSHLLGFNEQEEGSFITIALKEGLPIQRRGWPWIEISLKYIITEKATSVTITRNDQLLVRTKNNRQTELLLKSDKLGDTPATFALHETLNYTKGSIYAPDLMMLTTEEILDWMKPLGVTHIARPVHKPNSPVLFLTFRKLTCPTELKFEYTKYDVRPWFPTPMVCQKCGLIGHTKTRCAEPEKCLKCFCSPHGSSPCEIKCRNCSQNHLSTSKDCPKYELESKILKLSYQEKIPYGRAKAELGKSSQAAHIKVSKQQQDSHLELQVKNLESKIDTMANAITTLTNIVATMVTEKQNPAIPQETSTNKQTVTTVEPKNRPQSENQETDLIIISTEPDPQTPPKRAHTKETDANKPGNLMTPDHQYAATDETELNQKSNKKQKKSKNTKTVNTKNSNNTATIQ